MMCIYFVLCVCVWILCVCVFVYVCVVVCSPIIRIMPCHLLEALIVLPLVTLLTRLVTVGTQDQDVPEGETSRIERVLFYLMVLIGPSLVEGQLC